MSTAPKSDISVSTTGKRKLKKSKSTTTSSTKGNNDDDMLDTTNLVLSDLLEESRFFQEAARIIPSFAPEEVQTGSILGTGEFGIVSVVTKLQIADTGAADKVFQPSSSANDRRKEAPAIEHCQAAGQPAVESRNKTTPALPELPFPPRSPASYVVRANQENNIHKKGVAHADYCRTASDIGMPTTNETAAFKKLPHRLPSASSVAFADQSKDQEKGVTPAYCRVQSDFGMPTNEATAGTKFPSKRPSASSVVFADQSKDKIMGATSAHYRAESDFSMPDEALRSALVPPSPKTPPKSILILPPAHRNEKQQSKASMSAVSSSTSNAEQDSAKSENSINVSDYDELSEGENDYIINVHDLRLRMASQLYRDGRPRYAIKRLKRNLSAKMKTEAAIDLACEAKFLGNIAHSNIVRLRATVGTPGTVEYALILDCLTQTLDERMISWREKDRRYRGKLGMFGRDNNKIEHMITERLLVAFDIARALRHLHNMKILYRDTKPENIGFDVRGDVQIFDFGLAKELKTRDQKDDDGYEATGLTGSRKYMAPEVVRCELYGFSADVYSYSILFWEIMSLKTAFASYDANRHFQNVVMKNKRPGKLPHLPDQLQAMMETAWDKDRKKRPTFKQVCQILSAAVFYRTGDSTAGVSDRTAYLMSLSYRSFYEEREK